MSATTKDAKTDLSSRLLILIFVILAAGILVSGYLYYSSYEKNYRTQIEHQLSAIADLKVGELVQWRKERLGDANLLYKNPAFSGLVQRYFEHPDDVDAQEQLRYWLSRFQVYGQYSRIFLMDTRNVGRIFVPDVAESVPGHITQDADKVLQSGKVTILDLERDDDAPPPHMAILTPIFREKDSNVPLGVVVMRIDPSQYLYPLIQKWPTPSTTAETFIVRREGKDALFLNELKFQKETALKLRISLDNIEMPSVQAALGHEGIMEGVDYRGVPVIADVRRVPDSPWFMVARVDTSEVYAPLIQMLWLITALVGALLIGTGTTVGLIWRHENIRVYKERAEVADELRESEAQYRVLADNTTDGIWLLDMNLKLIYCSPSSEKQSGFTLQEIMEMSLDQYFTPGSLKVVSEAFLEEMPKVEANPDYNPVLALDLEYYKKDGTAFWAESKFSIIRDKHGEPVSILGVARDITERKQAEGALQKSNNLFNRIVDQSPIAMWISDEKGTLIRINRACCELLNITDKEVLGKYNIFHDNIVEKQGHMPQVKSVFEEGKTVRFELRYDTAELESLHMEGRALVILDITIFPIMDTNGHIINAMIHQMDITERRRAEEALRASELKYRSLIETSGAGVASVDLQGNLIFINQKFCKLTGYTEVELMGKIFNNYIHPGDRARVQDIFLQGLENPELKPEIELRVVCKNGNYIWLYSSPSALIAEGEFIGFTVLAVDITERKGIELELLASRDQLRNLAVRLQLAREDERKNIALEIHDDLGQSLTALQIDLSWLIKRIPDNLEELLRKAQAMLKLVTDADRKVRELATGLRPPLLDDLGFVTAAKSYIEEFEKKTDIKCEFLSEPAEILLDANVSLALFRVLQGSLINAAKHAKATRIKISMIEQTDGLYLDISDNGRGITGKELGSRKSIGIVGMRERMAFFGGSLQIEGVPEKGTTVKVKIPVQREMFQ